MIYMTLYWLLLLQFESLASLSLLKDGGGGGGGVHRGRDHMVDVPITTNIVSLNPTHG